MLHCVPDAPKDYSKQGDKLRAILHGLVFTEQLAFDYHGSGGPRQHTLEPLTLMMHRSALYLVARRPGEKRPFTYAVDRIAKVAPGREKFAYPDVTEFDPARHFEGSFGIFLSPDGDGKKTDVELVFANKRWLKLAVRERRWHPTQRFREFPDGRLEMKFKVENMVEVWPWIRSFGNDVVVRRPRGERRERSR
jgi:proteasome accessory factor B